jgi:glycosyltransferase involved in cell wall biosynthesis
MKIIIVIPCHNEKTVLQKNIKEILEAIKIIPQDIKIVISDNNSKDRTGDIGRRLAQESDRVEYVFVGEQGKGAAVMEAWKRFDADIYGFMDADLATDLGALPGAIRTMNSYDAVIGSRRIVGARVNREFYRRFTSVILNLIIRLMFGSCIKDTPCGFKFFRRKIIEQIAPLVKDRRWTFDTELLILAERAGFKIKEIPVKWEEKGERKSRVSIYPTASGYLKKLWEIRKRLSAGNSPFKNSPSKN